MEYTNLVTASRIKESDPLKNVSANQESDEANDVGGDIVTIVNGTTKPLLDINNWQADDFKCQVPNVRLRKFQMGNKPRNKSCERLFECINPFKHASVAKKTHVMQSFQTTKGILKSNAFSYQKKSTRRVHFLSICEEASIRFISFNYSQRKNNAQIKNEEMDWEPEEIELKNEIKEDSSPESKKIRKAISSEDFVQNISFQKLF